MPPKKVVAQDNKNNKNVKDNKDSKNIQSKITTESDSDDSNAKDVESEDDVDENNDDDVDDEDKDEEKVVDQPETKKKSEKKKLDYEEINSKIEESNINIKILKLAQKDLDKQSIENEKLQEKEFKQIEVNLKLLPKALETKIKAEMKNRKKHEHNGKGINEDRPVPNKLTKYLGLQEDVLLARTKVHSLFSDKVKEDGLKKEKEKFFEITPQFAKHFGTDKIKTGDTFEAKGLHTLLKLIYENC